MSDENGRGKMSCLSRSKCWCDDDDIYMLNFFSFWVKVSRREYVVMYVHYFHFTSRGNSGVQFPHALNRIFFFLGENNLLWKNLGLRKEQALGQSSSSIDTVFLTRYRYFNRFHFLFCYYYCCTHYCKIHAHVIAFIPEWKVSLVVFAPYGLRSCSLKLSNLTKLQGSQWCSWFYQKMFAKKSNIIQNEFIIEMFKRHS